MTTAAAGWDARISHGLIRFLRRPAVFLAANWAAMLGVVLLVGLVPALAASTRTTTDPDADDDTTFTSTLRQIRATLSRDWPISLGVIAFVAFLVGDVAILASADVGTRVFLGGALIPVVWAVIAWLSAYVVTAADPALDRGEVARIATARIVTQPGRAMLASALVLLLSPVWLLAPLTIAIGFSLPPWALARHWGPAPRG